MELDCLSIVRILELLGDFHVLICISCLLNSTEIVHRTLVAGKFVNPWSTNFKQKSILLKITYYSLLNVLLLLCAFITLLRALTFPQAACIFLFNCWEAHFLLAQLQ